MNVTLLLPTEPLRPAKSLDNFERFVGFLEQYTSSDDGTLTPYMRGVISDARTIIFLLAQESSGMLAEVNTDTIERVAVLISRLDAIYKP